MHLSIRPFGLRAALAPVVMLMMTAGCIGGSPACDALPRELELTLSARELEPPDPAVCRGADVTFTIHPEIDGVFHIHGYDDEAEATEVTAGEPVVFEFRASRSGQFPIELHTAENTQGIDVGLLTVHEP